MLSLRAARLNRDLTLADVADRLGVSTSSVAEAERRDAAGTITLASRARYLAAMGLTDTTLTVTQDPESVQSIWYDSVDGAAQVQAAMAMENQPISPADAEQIAVRTFGERILR